MKRSKKAEQRPAQRQADYQRMMNDPANTRKNMTGYHMPGSKNK